MSAHFHFPLEGKDKAASQPLKNFSMPMEAGALRVVRFAVLPDAKEVFEKVFVPLILLFNA